MLNLVELATRLKTARKGLGLTLDELAERSGLAKGVLSKVENFRVTPSLPSIIKLSSALNIPLEKLFEGLDKKPITCIIRKDDRKQIERNPEKSNIEYYDLAHLRPNRRMDPFELIIPAGGGRKKMLSHEGEEFLRVIKGSLTFKINEEEQTLEEGDSIYFDAENPHCLYNTTKKDAVVVCVFLGR